ncbi:MAG: hypothetical protein OSJ56_11160 [Prevotella sp.]|nr:hypothetical protein [Prevotella sp.]
MMKHLHRPNCFCLSPGKTCHIITVAKVCRLSTVLLHLVVYGAYCEIA